MDTSLLLKDSAVNKERMIKYKTFAVAFSYPDDSFFEFFPQALPEKENLQLEYDKLFRSSEIWLYGAEYLAENEFQRAQILSDINGFYKAFGVQPDKDRPDSLTAELEFMHYLILKEINAPSEDKSFICLDAQKKFFNTHLYPAVKKIAKKIAAKDSDNFYTELARELLVFLEEEKRILVKSQ